MKNDRRNILNTATTSMPKVGGDGIALYSAKHTKADWKRLEEGLPKLIEALNRKFSAKSSSPTPNTDTDQKP